jgi:hypothetical protein
VESLSAHPPVESELTSTESTGASPARDVHGVEVTPTKVHIHDVSIDRAAVVKYLEGIAPEKQEIALVHALEVGVTELIARRARFKA